MTEMSEMLSVARESRPGVGAVLSFQPDAAGSWFVEFTDSCAEDSAAREWREIVVGWAVVVGADDGKSYLTEIQPVVIDEFSYVLTLREYLDARDTTSLKWAINRRP